MFILMLITIAVISLIYLYFNNKYSYWSKRNVLYEPPTFPFGNLFPIFKGVHLGTCISSLYHKFQEPYFGFYAFWLPILMIKDPNIIKHVLVKDFDNFRNRPIAMDEKADPFAYKFMIGMRDGEWKNMRAKLTPIFTTGKLKLMLPLMQACEQDLRTYIVDNIDSVLEMKEVCAKYTTDVITSCAFGVDGNCFKSENAEFRVAGRRMFAANIKRAIQGTSYFFAHTLVSLFKFKFFDPEAAEFLKKVFWQVMEKRESGEVKPRNDLIDILIGLKRQDPEWMKGETLPAQAITFFGAGHETTSSAISFTLYELSLQPKVQNKLLEEILQVQEKNGGITYEGLLQDMKYLDMVVSETLRKYPFAPFITRTASQDYKIPGHDLVLEKNTQIFIPVMGLHYEPKYFPEPKKFDPERFTEENKLKRPQHIYLPFGDGPRNCIGQRFGLLGTKLAVVSIVKEFEILRSDSTPDQLEFNPRANLLMPIGGVPLKFKLRK